MQLNDITKGKAVPLGIIIIILCYLTSGAQSSIVPFILFTGILVGLMKNNDVKESAAASALTSFIGSFIVIAFTLIITYISYGSIYLNYILSSYIIYFVMYMIVGIIGGILGYYISKEIEL